MAPAFCGQKIISEQKNMEQKRGPISFQQISPNKRQGKFGLDSGQIESSGRSSGHEVFIFRKNILTGIIRIFPNKYADFEASPLASVACLLAARSSSNPETLSSHWHGCVPSL